MDRLPNQGDELKSNKRSRVPKTSKFRDKRLLVGIIAALFRVLLAEPLPW